MAEKPLRVFVRGSKFYVRYFAGGKDASLSTGITADIDQPESISTNPEWWKASTHADEIAGFVAEARKLRDATRKRQQREKLKAKRRTYIDDLLEALPEIPDAPNTLETILEKYEARAEARGGDLSNGMKARRRQALKLLRRFDPSYTVAAIDDDWINRFRKWVKTANNGKPYMDATMNGYVTDYRTVISFGIKSGFISGDNPFEGVSFHNNPPPPKRKTDWLDEQKILTFLYAENKPLFDQVLFERLTGFRVTWTCELTLKEIDRKHARITSLNRKGNRWTEFPIIEPLAWLLDQIDTQWVQGKVWKLEVVEENRFKPFAFKYRDRNSVYSNLSRACDYAAAPHMGTHKWRSNYITEWRRYTGDPDVINFLSHHSPAQSATKVSRMHYVDPEEIYELGRETLTRAQVTKWMPFLKSLRDVKPSGKSYTWSNPKGHWKNRA